MKYISVMLGILIFGLNDQSQSQLYVMPLRTPHVSNRNNWWPHEFSYKACK